MTAATARRSTAPVHQWVCAYIRASQQVTCPIGSLSHRRIYTKMPLRTDSLHAAACTWTLSYTDTFYTQTLLHTDAFTHRCTPGAMLSTQKQHSASTRTSKKDTSCSNHHKLRICRPHESFAARSSLVATKCHTCDTITLARGRKQCEGGLAVNIPDTSSNSYGPATDEVRRDRSCNSRTCYIDLYQRSSQDLDTRTSYERPRKLSDKRQRRGS